MNKSHHDGMDLTGGDSAKGLRRSADRPKKQKGAATTHFKVDDDDKQALPARLILPTKLSLIGLLVVSAQLFGKYLRRQEGTLEGRIFGAHSE